MKAISIISMLLFISVSFNNNIIAQEQDDVYFSPKNSRLKNSNSDTTTHNYNIKEANSPKSNSTITHRKSIIFDIAPIIPVYIKKYSSTGIAVNISYQYDFGRHCAGNISLGYHSLGLKETNDIISHDPLKAKFSYFPIMLGLTNTLGEGNTKFQLNNGIGYFFPLGDLKKGGIGLKHAIGFVSRTKASENILLSMLLGYCYTFKTETKELEYQNYLFNMYVDYIFINIGIVTKF